MSKPNDYMSRYSLHLPARFHRTDPFPHAHWEDEFPAIGFWPAFWRFIRHTAVMAIWYALAIAAVGGFG